MVGWTESTMPLYEYRCTVCGHRFERIRKFSDPPLTECPECGGLVEKLISSPAIQFKGAGWYVNDYARSGKPDAAKTEKSEKDTKAETSASSSGESTKSDSTKSDSGKGDSAKGNATPAKPASDPAK
jgi:putative FmdB family regulatory protein